MNTNFIKLIICKLFSYQIIRYGFIGCISTLIHFIVAITYLHFFDNNLFYANITAFIIAYIFSYLAQSFLTFKNKISFKKALKYFIIQIGVLLLSVTLSDILIQMNNYIKTYITILLMPLITFIIHKFYTFKK